MEFGVMTTVAFEFPACRLGQGAFFPLQVGSVSAWSFGILDLMPREGPVHLLSFLILSRLLVVQESAVMGWNLVSTLAMFRTLESTRANQDYKLYTSSTCQVPVVPYSPREKRPIGISHWMCRMPSATSKVQLFYAA